MDVRSVLRAVPGEAGLLGTPEVRVAVLDGPVDFAHPCFAGADLTRLATLVPDAAGSGPMSLHGTHVASLLFGQPGSPVGGLVPRCRGFVLPVFRESADGGVARVPQLDLARAVEQAVEAGAHVINISGGERSADGRAEAMLERALRRCAENGVLVVAAVGNDGCDCLQAPAATPSVLAVGATDAAGEPLDINNWGPVYRTNGVLAPGRDIATSSRSASPRPTPSSATSDAVPHTAHQGDLMYKTPTHPELPVPVQTPPVHRDRFEVPADGATDRGAATARSVCGNLVGTARQMCRAMQGD